MVEIGSLVSSLPDHPVPIQTVEGLEAHDAIVVAVPIQTDAERDRPVTERFAVVTASMGVILEYFPDRGWAVVKHVSGENRSPKEMVIALVGESITWQDELDDLAEAAMTGSLDDHLANSELRDLFES